MKLSHEDPKVPEELVHRFNGSLFRHMPLVLHCGKVHEYLGMTLDLSGGRKVKLYMEEYIKDIFEEAPTEIYG